MSSIQFAHRPARNLAGKIHWVYRKSWFHQSRWEALFDMEKLPSEALLCEFLMHVASGNWCLFAFRLYLGSNGETGHPFANWSIDHSATWKRLSSCYRGICIRSFVRSSTVPISLEPQSWLRQPSHNPLHFLLLYCIKLAELDLNQHSLASRGFGQFGEGNCLRWLWGLPGHCACACPGLTNSVLVTFDVWAL